MRTDLRTRLATAVAATTIPLSSILVPEVAAAQYRDTRVFACGGVTSRPSCTAFNEALYDPTAVSLSGTYVVGGATVSVDAAAWSRYGSLGVRASSQVMGSAFSPIGFDLRAVAIFVDGITIDFEPWRGQPGLLAVAYTLDGTLNWSGVLPPPFISVSAAVTTLGTPSQGQEGVHPVSANGTFWFPQFFTFTYGTPFGLWFSLQCHAGTATTNFEWSRVTGPGSKNCDADNTLVLSGLRPSDLGGNLAANATFTSASGTEYGPNGVAAVVPEPRSAWLLSSGLVAVATVLRRKRHRRFASVG
jgi:hypothetical protein